MDRKAFYDVVRKNKAINLTEQNVFGCEKHLDYAIAHDIPIKDCAYALATSYWETGGTFHPVVEAYWLSESWRANNLRYYPWHGRGLIQTTWERNYREVGKLLGVGEDYFIVAPDRLLQWKYALPALFKAMKVGLYTGKSFDDYIKDEIGGTAEDRRQFVNARRIVNGTDKAGKIADIGLTFLKALRESGYGRTRMSGAAETSNPKNLDDTLAAGLDSALNGNAPPTRPPCDKNAPVAVSGGLWAQIIRVIAKVLGGGR